MKHPARMRRLLALRNSEASFFSFKCVKFHVADSPQSALFSKIQHVTCQSVTKDCQMKQSPD
ncbi:hypothetical protein, partial [Limnobacter sp.]|uniref:hypothetical protein n=1 Tax=Limnobacter sp. TaxID=2003368 RepID=UPI002732C0E6